MVAMAVMALLELGFNIQPTKIIGTAVVLHLLETQILLIILDIMLLTHRVLVIVEMQVLLLIIIHIFQVLNHLLLVVL